MCPGKKATNCSQELHCASLCMIRKTKTKRSTPQLFQNLAQQGTFLDFWVVFVGDAADADRPSTAWAPDSSSSVPLGEMKDLCHWDIRTQKATNIHQHSCQKAAVKVSIYLHTCLQKPWAQLCSLQKHVFTKKQNQFRMTVPNCHWDIGILGHKQPPKLLPECSSESLHKNNKDAYKKPWAHHCSLQKSCFSKDKNIQTHTRPCIYLQAWNRWWRFDIMRFWFLGWHCM